MTDEIQLAREARPYAAGPSPELVRTARAELLKEIAGAQRWTRRRTLPIAVPALASVIAAAIVAVAVLGRGSESAWAAELVRVAEQAPRLLVDAPGWRVTRADQFGADLGEMTFSNGERELELRWSPAQRLAQTLRDRGDKVDVVTTVRAGGAEIRVFRYRGTNDFTAVWVRGDSMLELRGFAADAATFASAVVSLRGVDVDSWLSAMPESVVKPESRAQVVEEMLSGVPLPAGFDTAALRRGDVVRDRYQLGAQVAGAVACSWLKHWSEARHSGDETAARAAVDAMATSNRWPVLLEMNELGDYPEVLWQYADAMATNAAIAAGKALSVEESYAAALGCD